MLPAGHTKRTTPCCLPVSLQLCGFIYPYNLHTASFAFFLKEVELFLALKHQFLLRDFVSLGNHRPGSSSSLTCTFPLRALLCIMRKGAEEPLLVYFSFFKCFDRNQISWSRLCSLCRLCSSLLFNLLLAERLGDEFRGEYLEVEGNGGFCACQAITVLAALEWIKAHTRHE